MPSGFSLYFFLLSCDIMLSVTLPLNLDIDVNHRFMKKLGSFHIKLVSKLLLLMEVRLLTNRYQIFVNMCCIMFVHFNVDNQVINFLF